MTDRDIQTLIDRYLEGETSPEEEHLLAEALLRPDIPEEWQAVRLMLGELAMGEAEYDHIMATRLSKPRARSIPTVWRWTAAAASLLLVAIGTWLFGTGNDTPLANQPVGQPLEAAIANNEPATKVATPPPTASPVTSVQQQKRQKKTNRQAAKPGNPVDSLEYYIDKIERELAHVDESLYIERMQKVIQADDRLQRLVNHYILQAADKQAKPQQAVNTNQSINN